MENGEKARPSKAARIGLVVGAAVICVLLVVVARLLTWWKAYSVPDPTGQIVPQRATQSSAEPSEGASEESSVSDDVAQWYVEWVGRQSQIGVAPQYQVSSVDVREATQLPGISSQYGESAGDSGEKSNDSSGEESVGQSTGKNDDLYVRIDATVYPRFSSLERISENGAPDCQTYRMESGINESCVFRLEPQTDGYRIARVMPPIIYERAAHPEQFEKTDPDPTAPVLDGNNGYRLTKEKLEVTYDAGVTWREVPDGVARVVGAVNANTELWLEPTSYIITPDFTAFVGYDDDSHAAQLLYSWDSGATWLTSTLGTGEQAPSYVSVAGDRIAVAHGYGRALGSTGYVMVASTLTELRGEGGSADGGGAGADGSAEADGSDGTSGTEADGGAGTEGGASAVWRSVPLYMQYPSNLTTMGWTDDTTVFVGQSGSLHISQDSGATWRELPLPKEPSSGSGGSSADGSGNNRTDSQGSAGDLDYNPFDTPTRVWVQDGVTYVFIGQGDDADYAPDGEIKEAVFAYDAASDSFTFIDEQTAPGPTSAG